MFNAGDVAANSVVRIPFNSEAIAGGSITIGTNGTIAIYKDDSTTERNSPNGITFVEDHDTHTGTHTIKIDLSDNTDTGFYAAGSTYLVKYHTATIDGKTVNAWVGAFTIDKTRQKVDVVSYGGTAGTFSGGRPEVNASHWGGTAVASATVRADMVAVSGDTAAADNFETMLDGTGGQTLKLGKLSVVASGGARAVEFIGNGAAEGFYVEGGATGSGLVCRGGLTSGYAAEMIAQGGNSNALNLQGQGSGLGLYIVGGVTGGGMAIESNQIGLSIISAVNTGILVSVDGSQKSIRLLSGGGTGALVGDIEGNLDSVTLATTLTTYTGNTPQTGDCYPRLGAPAGASHAADVAAIQTKLGTPAGVSIAADIAAAKLDTAATLVDTNELQLDWTNGGRLDLLLDGVKGKTDTITDVYHARIHFTRDDAGSRDEWTVFWFKNGVRQTAVTSPLIEVLKRADGSNLIAASTAMSLIASTGVAKYDATTVERLTAGEAAIVLLTATIDGSPRTFAELTSRDSTA